MVSAILHVLLSDDFTMWSIYPEKNYNQLFTIIEHYTLPILKPRRRTRSWQGVFLALDCKGVSSVKVEIPTFNSLALHILM